jgi:hypothetical protein
VRACKASHQCADYFVFHTSKATPITAAGPDCKEALPTCGARDHADQPARDPRIGGGDLDLQPVIVAPACRQRRSLMVCVFDADTRCCCRS